MSALFATVNEAYTSIPTPAFYYTLIALAIGCAISISVNLIVLPSFAHVELRLFLQQWAKLIGKSMGLVVDYYSTGNILDLPQIDQLESQLLAKMAAADIILNDAASEVNYSTLGFKQLSIACDHLKGLTTNAFSLYKSARNFRNWIDNSDQFSLSRPIQKLTEYDFTTMNYNAKAIIYTTNKVVKNICDSLDIRKAVLGSDASEELIDFCVNYENELRNLLDHYYLRHKIVNKDEKDFADHKVIE